MMTTSWRAVPLTLLVLAASCGDRAVGLGLIVYGVGDGSGTVSSTPRGITCSLTKGSPSCTGAFAVGTKVTLTATPSGTTPFAGWGGACSGKAACEVVMDRERRVGATFGAPSAPGYSLAISGAGNGSGKVTSYPDGQIDCQITAGTTSGNCTGLYAHGTVVFLSPTSIDASAFGEWGDDCTGSSQQCMLTLDKFSGTKAKATFVIPTSCNDAYVNQYWPPTSTATTVTTSLIFETGGCPIEGWAEVATDPSFSTIVATSPITRQPASPQYTSPVDAVVSGLQPNTLYIVRGRVRNAHGTSYSGSDQIRTKAQ